ncbi:hypothetical protein N1851_026595 [Merluccius polli]|uniref:Uncharacterized protein n=1 Tax=Merluccius polli TaxID=89951 RepID=A0AA47MBU8_MERPO|nr:hypothetical protein N1851_026595 [Merluccius polli]
MEAFGVPTPRMDWESSNLPDAWRRFKQHAELMFTGPLKNKSEEEQCSFLLLWIGDKGQDRRRSGESFEHFVTELKFLVKDCGYANSEEMVRDHIVFATNLPRVREKSLSQGPELTLDKAINITRSHELSQVQLKAMASDSHEVHAVHRKTGRPGAVNMPADNMKAPKRPTKPVVHVGDITTS